MAVEGGYTLRVQSQAGRVHDGLQYLIGQAVLVHKKYILLLKPEVRHQGVLTLGVLAAGLVLGEDVLGGGELVAGPQQVLVVGPALGGVQMIKLLEVVLVDEVQGFFLLAPLDQDLYQQLSDVGPALDVQIQCIDRVLV